MKNKTLEIVKVHESNRSIKKKPYLHPQFRVYGSLHLQTQGSALGKNDAGGSQNGGKF